MGDLKFYTTGIKYIMFRPAGDITKKDNLTLLLPGYLAAFNSPDEYENIVNGVKIMMPGAKKVDESIIDHEATQEQRALLIKRSPRIMCFGHEEIMVSYSSLLSIIDRMTLKAKKDSARHIKEQQADGNEEPKDESQQEFVEEELQAEENIDKLIEDIERPATSKLYVRSNGKDMISYSAWDGGIVQPNMCDEYVFGWVAAMAYLGLKTSYEAAELFRKNKVKVFEAKRGYIPKYMKCAVNQTAFLLEELNRVRCAGDA